MSGARQDVNYAHPADQGRLGRSVERALHRLADMADSLCVGQEDELLRPVPEVANYTTIRLFEFAQRKEKLGRLRPAAKTEFTMAESLMSAVREVALRWTHGDVKSRRPGPDEGDEGREIGLPRSADLEHLICLAEVIRVWFPSDTAERWREMARVAACEASPPDPVPG